MEGLLLDTEGRLIEGTMSNLFMISKGVLQTPDLHSCGVAGVMRSVILELAGQQALETGICDLRPADLAQADEVFLTNSLIGIWPVAVIDDKRYDKGPLTQRLQALLARHTDHSGGWRE